MSKQNRTAEQREQKVLTNYDKKQARRAAEKEQAAKEAKRGKIIGIAILALIVAFIASFPIRNYLALNATFITIGDEKITKAEFDYNYSMLVNTYLSNYGTILSYFGLDTDSDFADQMYSDTLTWQDFFEEMTVESITQNIALKKEGEAAGFEYDATEDYENFVNTVKEAASEAGVSTKSYIQALYGDYATSFKRIESTIKETLYATAYYAQKQEELAATAEEIEAYYAENTDSYDSVDFYVITVAAELPTEPTDLADEDSLATYDPDDEDTEYEPSDAEITAAMEEAYVLAEAALETILEEGTYYENLSYSSASSYYADWLFEEGRTAGDCTIIENSTSNLYYILYFVDRYLDTTPTASLRLILTQEDTDGQAILDEWAAGEATEESFAALAVLYSEDSDTAEDGGLYEDLAKAEMDETLAAWIFADGRSAGDTVALWVEDQEAWFVMYYLGQGEASYYTSIASTLLSSNLNDYLDEIVSRYEVSDPKGNLNYLIVEAAEAAADEEE